MVRPPSSKLLPSNTCRARAEGWTSRRCRISGGKDKEEEDFRFLDLRRQSRYIYIFIYLFEVELAGEEVVGTVSELEKFLHGWGGGVADGEARGRAPDAERPYGRPEEE